MRKQSRLDRLFKKFKMGKLKVKLKGGEVKYLTSDDLLELITESMMFAGITNNEGTTVFPSASEYMNMSEGLYSLKDAKLGQDKALDMLINTARKAEETIEGGDDDF